MIAGDESSNINGSKGQQHEEGDSIYEAKLKKNKKRSQPKFTLDSSGTPAEN
jgi:hypothetical protein